LVFVETSVFTKRIALELLENPAAGDLDPGTGGLRKVRMADPTRGKGKRGGARVHYLWLPHRDVIYLLFAYSKDEDATCRSRRRRYFEPWLKASRRRGRPKGSGSWTRRSLLSC